MVLFYVFIIVVGLLIIGNLFTYALQDYFIFWPSKLSAGHQYHFTIPFEELAIQTERDGNINALWFHQKGAKRPMILYFHGNSGDLSKWGHLSTYFDELGCDLLIYDFRGFGKSTGPRLEATFHIDARAMYDWAMRHYSPSDIILMGRSMGSGVACKIAADVPSRMLILETPYHSIRNLFFTYYPFLPVFLFVFKYSFPCYKWLPSAQCPAYILQGDRDRVVPYRCSVRLKPFLREPSHFITIQGGKHKNLSEFDAYFTAIKGLLSSPPK